MFRRAVPSLRQLPQTNRFFSGPSLSEPEHSASSPPPATASPVSHGLPEKEQEPRLNLYSRGANSKQGFSKPAKYVQNKQQRPGSRHAAFKAKMIQLLRLAHQKTIVGCHKLTDLTQAMDSYRHYRDKMPPGERICASEVIDCALQSLRSREHILRPLIRSVRMSIRHEQNTRIMAYLEEILQDFEREVAYASTYGIAWMLTAYAAMDQRVKATEAWRRLLAIDSHDMKRHVMHPVCVGAAIHTADPRLLPLSEAEQMREDCIKHSGSHILLDEAMAKYYLAVGAFGPAVTLFSNMCSQYDVTNCRSTLRRLSNELLTQVTEERLGSALFVLSIQPNSLNDKLHPGAVAAYLNTYFNSTHDLDGVISKYKQALEVIKSQCEAGSAVDMVVQIMRHSVMKLVAEKYPLDCLEGRACFREIIAIDKGCLKTDRLAYNTALSRIYRAWPESSMIFDLSVELSRAANSNPLRIDSVRTLLSAASACSEITDEMIQDWIQKLFALVPKKFTFYDVLAICRACSGLYADKRSALLEKALLDGIKYEKLTDFTFDSLARSFDPTDPVFSVLAKLRKTFPEFAANVGKKDVPAKTADTKLDDQPLESSARNDNVDGNTQPETTKDSGIAFLISTETEIRGDDSSPALYPGYRREKHKAFKQNIPNRKLGPA